MPQEKKDVKFISNESLPSIFIDTLKFAERNDNICLMQFYTNLPAGLTEQVRLIARKDDLTAMLRYLCREMKFDPAEDKKSK
jgi:hypothetical protein